MLKRKPKTLTPAQVEEIRAKDFFDMILPGTIKFFSDHYIVGDSYRCVWAIREYPPSTEEQAILLKIPYITYLEGDVGAAPNESRVWRILYAEIGNPYGVAGLMGNLFAESGLQSNNLQDSYEDFLGYTDTSYTQAVDDGQYLMGKLLYRGDVVPQDITRAIDYLERAAEQKNPYAAYLAGKLRLTEAEVKDVLRAIRDFDIAAENGNDYAEYQLGKIYLYGKEVERDDEKAIAYLSSAAEHGNPYAEQLLHSIQPNRSWPATLGTIRLLHHLSRVIQNQLDEGKRDNSGLIDRKLKRKIDEKKQAHGLKQG